MWPTSLVIYRGKHCLGLGVGHVTNLGTEGLNPTASGLRLKTKSYRPQCMLKTVFCDFIHVSLLMKHNYLVEMSVKLESWTNFTASYYS